MSKIVPFVVANWGHGRVFPRRDRKRVACGHALGLCRDCLVDEVHLQWLRETPSAWSDQWQKLEPNRKHYLTMLGLT